MAKLLRRLDFVHKRPKCVPAKADEAAQRAFVAQTLLPLMQAADERSPLYFVDATHPAHTGRPADGWMRKGITRELRSNHGRVLARPQHRASPRREDHQHGDDRAAG